MTSAAENHYAERVRQLLNVPVTPLSVAGAQHGYQHLTATLADGRTVFAKAVSAKLVSAKPVSAEPVSARPVAGPAQASTVQASTVQASTVQASTVQASTVQASTVQASTVQAAALAAEANGLRWLAQAHAVPVPRVLGVAEDLLVIEFLPPGRPTAEAAAGFGAGLARLHAAGADAFGAPWPGFIASLPLDNTPGQEWGEWYAEQRLVPYLRKASDNGALSRADAGLVEAVAARTGELGGPAEPPSRIHGDLWSGNVLWSGGHGWLIDPAAHGGHRETDLAMLALFGAPHLDVVLRAYEQVTPLADGWRDRVPLHQLHPLLVHVCLFGASYAGQVRAAARAALAA